MNVPRFETEEELPGRSGVLAAGVSGKTVRLGWRYRAVRAASAFSDSSASWREGSGLPAGAEGRSFCGVPELSESTENI